MKNSLAKQIEKFLSSSAFGVVGASPNRGKYGNKVLRAYINQKMKVYPVNPSEKVIEDIPCVANVQLLPADVKSISIVTPPPITEKIVQQAIAKGIENIWIQPGAESQAAIDLAEEHHINVIAKGPCILVRLGFTES